MRYKAKFTLHFQFSCNDILNFYDIFKMADVSQGSMGRYIFFIFPVVMELSSPDMTVSGGGLPKTYTTAQFHFHWGKESSTGSEHTFNGRQYPLEVNIKADLWSIKSQRRYFNEIRIKMKFESRCKYVLRIHVKLPSVVGFIAVTNTVSCWIGTCYNSNSIVSWYGMRMPLEIKYTTSPSLLWVRIV